MTDVKTKSFTTNYRELAGGGKPAEKVVRPTIRERLLRCLWFDQKFDTALRTDAGEKITVLSPGWWNLESGPDFKNAVIRLGGNKAVKGDVEAHIYASGWEQHGHSADRAYDNVILHVVMWNDTGRATTTIAGREIPILALQAHIHTPVDKLDDTLSHEEYPQASGSSGGRCRELLSNTKIDPEWIGQFLSHAGDERIIRKAARLTELSGGGDASQMLYASLLEAAGYKQNKVPMSRVAKLIPLGLAEKLLNDGGVITLQAAMLGVAGLLPSPEELKDADDETLAYLSNLHQHWCAAKKEITGEPLEKTSWTFASVRPANYPHRRLIGISRLIQRSAATGGLIPTIERELRRAPATPTPRIAKSAAAREIILLLSGVDDDYWTYRMTFGGRKSESRTKLIGTDRAAVMFINCIVPVILASARKASDLDLENRLHRAFSTFPALEENSVQRFMETRIFGGAAPAAEVIKSARRQQGLLQLFRDFCDPDLNGCRRCAFANALETSG